MPRSARLLDLIQLLRRHRRPVTAAVLAGEVGVSERTLYRDIATLIAQGAPIEGAAGLGYVLRPGYLLPPLMFTEDQIEALVLGLRWAAGRGDGPLRVGAADALAKIAAVLPAEVADALPHTGLLAFSGGTATADLAILRRAIREQRKLAITYDDIADKHTERVIWPFALGFSDEVHMLAAWCELRQNFRHFRTDRIGCSRLMDARYPRRRGTLLAEWRAREGIPEPL